MRYYAYSIPGGKKGVTSDYSNIEELVLLHPYIKFRKFMDVNDAWNFVNKNGNRKAITSINNYGNTFNTLYLTVNYIIRDSCVYYNIDTSRVGVVRLDIIDPNVQVEYRGDSIAIKLSNTYLDNDSIISNLIAIYHILMILGNFIDVEVVVPDHSIFYALTAYTGDKYNIKRILKNIHKRKGKLGITVKSWEEDIIQETEE